MCAGGQASASGCEYVLMRFRCFLVRPCSAPCLLCACGRGRAASFGSDTLVRREGSVRHLRRACPILVQSRTSRDSAGIGECKLLRPFFTLRSLRRSQARASASPQSKCSPGRCYWPSGVGGCVCVCVHVTTCLSSFTHCLDFAMISFLMLLKVSLHW